MNLQAMGLHVLSSVSRLQTGVRLQQPMVMEHAVDSVHFSAKKKTAGPTPQQIENAKILLEIAEGYLVGTHPAERTTIDSVSDPDYGPLNAVEISMPDGRIVTLGGSFLDIESGEEFVMVIRQNAKDKNPLIQNLSEGMSDVEGDGATAYNRAHMIAFWYDKISDVDPDELENAKQAIADTKAGLKAVAGTPKTKAVKASKVKKQ